MRSGAHNHRRRDSHAHTGKQRPTRSSNTRQRAHSAHKHAEQHDSSAKPHRVHADHKSNRHLQGERSARSAKHKIRAKRAVSSIIYSADSSETSAELARYLRVILFNVQEATLLCLSSSAQMSKDIETIETLMRATIHGTLQSIASRLYDKGQLSQPDDVAQSLVADIQESGHKSKECKSAIADCHTQIRRAWRLLQKLLQDYPELRHQLAKLIRSAKYEKNIQTTAAQMWTKEASSALNIETADRHARTGLIKALPDKESKSAVSKLRHIPQVMLALSVAGMLAWASTGRENYSHVPTKELILNAHVSDYTKFAPFAPSAPP